VEVTFDGTPAPLLWVQDMQINVVAPWSLTPGQTTQVCVTYSGAKTNCLTWPVVETAPAVFTVISNFRSGPRGHFSGNSHRISFCVLNSPKSARRMTLRRPSTAEISEIAFKRVPGARKRKSRKDTRNHARGDNAASRPE
jgi:hypothetical protein